MVDPEEFNEAQKRRLLSSCSHIDKLLTDIEEILSASGSGGFPKYKRPLTPVQVRVARDYIKRLRQQILRILSDLRVGLPEARFDSAFSIQVNLQFVEVALEEIAPARLTGFGSVPPSLVEPLAGGIQEIKGIIRQISSYLSQPADGDLLSRLARLSGQDAGADFLRELGRIIDRHGLVEFRATLSQLMDKIENPAYEIAFFGRVSAGKSSLLNSIIGLNLLPTGVTPVTAVPTRVKNGSPSELRVWTADGKVNQFSIERLPDFVTEAGNSGNQKHVTGVLVQVRLPMLPDEVVLVDTPGLGSLALGGAAETLAYLPRCDLGVVLIDASSSLQTDDVGTVDALRTAGIPALVVLSKIDLLTEADRQRVLGYTRTQLAHQLGMEIQVAALSTRPELENLLQEWITNQIDPRVADARRLTRESVERKAQSLGRRVLHALELSAAAGAHRPARVPAGELSKAEDRLRKAASLIESTREKYLEQTDLIRDAGKLVIRSLAQQAILAWQTEPSSRLDPAWMRKHVNQLAQTQAEQVAHAIQSTSAELTSALDEAARCLSTGEREDSLDLTSLVKEMPSAEFSQGTPAIEKSLLSSISTRWAQRSVEHAIAKQLGTTLIEFFNSYGRAVEVWARTTLEAVAREFETHADIYRAQLQRLTSTTAENDGSGGKSVLQDIALLKEKLDLQETAEPLESTSKT